MWSYAVYGCKNYLIQEQKALNWILQMNFAEIEIKMIANYLKGLKMIKLSTGVEISEDTVVSALKKAGISVEPKHVFEAGDVAVNEGEADIWRFIIRIDGRLCGVDRHGFNNGKGQKYFEAHNYKFVGKLSDTIPIN